MEAEMTNSKTLLNETEQNFLFSSLDMITYFFVLSSIFYFISFKVVNVFIIIIWVFIHIISHKHFFNYFTKITSTLTTENNKSIVSILTQFLFVAILITRTIALIIYTFGYSNLLLKMQNKGNTYDIPKRYRYFETEFKKLYIIGSYVIFALLAMFTNFKDKIFSPVNVDLVNNTFGAMINILSVLSLFIFSYLATNNFNSINVTDRLIYTTYIFILLSIAILFIKKGIDYITNTILGCKIFNESKDVYVSSFFTFLTQIVGLSSLSLLIVTTVFEFIYAYKYQKLQGKY